MKVVRRYEPNHKIESYPNEDKNESQFEFVFTF